jgi:hypothetical protein
VTLPQTHLTYCTNIHPGETWPEVRDNLTNFLIPVRERFAPGRPFGLGLRLSGEAARMLARQEILEELRTFLRANDLYVFTINGFPYGPFHGRPVKEQVYLPDWLEPERLAYTNQLSDILAALLPDGVDGTISTVPGAFAPRVLGEEGSARIARALLSHVAHLARLHASTGKRVALALEPEPCCYLETIAETVEFFTRFLLAPAPVASLATALGCTPGAAEATIRDHLGVCLDTCHMAVEFEGPAGVLDALAAADIRVMKVQVTAGLRTTLSGDDAPALVALGEFADDVYLHQVVEKRADGTLKRYLDLPQAIDSAHGDREQREWRIHFHVPVFRATYGPFEGTQAYVAEVLRLVRERAACRQFEVETYTWNVLPAEFRHDGIVTAITRELEWAATQLASS